MKNILQVEDNVLGLDGIGLATLLESRNYMAFVNIRPSGPGIGSGTAGPIYIENVPGPTP